MPLRLMSIYLLIFGMTFSIMSKAGVLEKSLPIVDKYINKLSLAETDQERTKIANEAATFLDSSIKDLNDLLASPSPNLRRDLLINEKGQLNDIRHTFLRLGKLKPETKGQFGPNACGKAYVIIYGFTRMPHLENNPVNKWQLQLDKGFRKTCPPLKP